MFDSHTCDGTGRRDADLIAAAMTLPLRERYRRATRATDVWPREHTAIGNGPHTLQTMAIGHRPNRYSASWLGGVPASGILPRERPPMTPEQAQHLVAEVAGRFEQREDAFDALLARGLCEHTAGYVLDMIDMAHSRAVTNFIGVPLRNMSSNVDDDPVFRAALDHFLARIPRSPRPWWKFW